MHPCLWTAPRNRAFLAAHGALPTTGATRRWVTRNSSRVVAHPAASALVGAALCALGALLPVPAQAAVAARAPSGAEVVWTLSEIVLRPAPPSTRSTLSLQQLVEALERACAIWNTALAETKAPRLRVGKPLRDATVREDGHSLVVLRTEQWCPDDAKDQDDCYDPARQAITHLYPLHVAGKAGSHFLREADVEINAKHHAFRMDGPAALRLDVVLAHELGHVLGLDHDCAITDRAARRSGLVPCDAPGANHSIMYPGSDVTHAALPREAEVAFFAERYGSAPTERRSTTLIVLLAVAGIASASLLHRSVWRLGSRTAGAVRARSSA
jgi:hypothetical protein